MNVYQYCFGTALRSCPELYPTNYLLTHHGLLLSHKLAYHLWIGFSKKRSIPTLEPWSWYHCLLYRETMCWLYCAQPQPTTWLLRHWISWPSWNLWWFLDTRCQPAMQAVISGTPIVWNPIWMASKGSPTRWWWWLWPLLRGRSLRGIARRLMQEICEVSESRYFTSLALNKLLSLLRSCLLC